MSKLMDREKNNAVNILIDRELISFMNVDLAKDLKKQLKLMPPFELLQNRECIISRTC